MKSVTRYPVSMAEGVPVLCQKCSMRSLDHYPPAEFYVAGTGEVVTHIEGMLVLRAGNTFSGETRCGRRYRVSIGGGLS